MQPSNLIGLSSGAQVGNLRYFQGSIQRIIPLLALLMLTGCGSWFGFGGAADEYAPGNADITVEDAFASVEALMTGEHYYVSPDGDDDNDGLSEESPFETILQAIITVRAGDTIHLGPGEYFETMMTVRDGTPEAPITIIGPPEAIIRGEALDNVLMRINHDYYTLYGFSFDGLYGDPDKMRGYKDKLLYAQKHEVRSGIKGLRVLNITFQNAGAECVRLRYFLTESEVAFSRFHNCGIWDFVFDEGGKVGEAIYMGTSSKQWDDGKNRTSDPDETMHNWIHHNFMDTQGNECAEVKEGGTANIIEYNECTGQKDPESAGIVARGSGNIIRYNTIYGNVGAGVRVGGHTVDGIQYGQENEVYGNELYNNTAGGVKIMVPSQAKVCDNNVYDNEGGPVVGEYAADYNPTVSCP
ncbi:MAG: DUF1565 domain-containing protein [Chloroflexota bacterium]